MSAGGTETETPGKTTLRQETVSLISTILIGCAAASFLVGTLGSWLILLAVPLYALAKFGATLIHEIGHALGALLVGWRVKVMTVWPVALHVPTRQIIVSARVSTSDGGGYLFSTPGTLSRNRASRYIVIILAGPLASLAMGILACWIAGSQFAPSTDVTPGIYGRPTINLFRQEMVRLYFCATLGFALINFANFVMTIVPASKSLNKFNDGRMIADLLQGGTKSARPTVTWVASLIEYRSRPRDIPDWMYEAARAENSKAVSIPPIYDGWDIARALDAATVDPNRTRTLIENYRTAYGNSDWLLNCDAWLAAVHENDVERAEKALELRQADPGGRAMHAVAEAAVAARRGQHAIVEKKLWWLDQELRADSAFPNATFRDLRKAVVAIAATTAPATA